MPELIDICDTEGHLTGESMARSEAHRQELWHRSVIVWVIDSRGRILVQRRAEHLGGFPGLWDASVDGHISAGDEPTPTAIRELQEELGIQAEANDLHFTDTLSDRYMMTYGKMHQEFDFIFVLHRDVAIDDLKLQAAEVIEARWISADELERELRERPADFSTRNPQVYQIAFDAARDQEKVPQE